jgi:hypothetical protein
MRVLIFLLLMFFKCDALNIELIRAENQELWRVVHGMYNNMSYILNGTRDLLTDPVAPGDVADGTRNPPVAGDEVKLRPVVDIGGNLFKLGDLDIIADPGAPGNGNLTFTQKYEQWLLTAGPHNTPIQKPIGVI